jgi:hypothetical protein
MKYVVYRKIAFNFSVKIRLHLLSIMGMMLIHTKLDLRKNKMLSF